MQAENANTGISRGNGAFAAASDLTRSIECADTEAGAPDVCTRRDGSTGTDNVTTAPKNPDGI